MENITKKKVLLAILVLVFSILFFSYWTSCRMDGTFFFSPLDLKLRIIFDIRGDNNLPSWEGRFFHNKLTQGSIDIFNAYVRFWDVRFLLLVVSPFTLFALFARLYYLIKRHMYFALYEKCMIVFSLLFPFVVLFGKMKNDTLSFFLIALPLIILSFRGLFAFCSYNKHYLQYLFIVATLSLWYLLILHSAINDFCHL